MKLLKLSKRNRPWSLSFSSFLRKPPPVRCTEIGDFWHTRNTKCFSVDQWDARRVTSFVTLLTLFAKLRSGRFLWSARRTSPSAQKGQRSLLVPVLSPITGGVWSCTQNGIAVPFAQKGKLSLFAPPVQDWVESTVHSTEPG